MKRLFTLIVAVLYTVSSIGMNVSTHYCASKVMTCKCAKPKASDKKDHCCKDIVKYVKSQDSHQFQDAGIFKKQHAVIVILPVSLYSEIATSDLAKVKAFRINSNLTHLNGPPLYRLFCNYRV